MRVPGTMHNFSAFASKGTEGILAQFVLGNESLTRRVGFKCWYIPFAHRSPAAKRENFRVTTVVYVREFGILASRAN